MLGRLGEKAVLVKLMCLQRSQRIRPVRGRAERCSQLGSAVTFPSIRSKLMIAPDPLPSGCRATTNTSSRARGAGEEDTAAGSWLRLAAEALGKQKLRIAEDEVGATCWGSLLGQVSAACLGL